MSLTALDKAVADALCPTFQTLATATAVLPYFPLWTETTGAVGVSAANTATALSLLGVSATCGSVDIGPDPNNGLQTGCTKASSGVGLLATKTDGSEQGIAIASNVVSIDNIELGQDSFGYAVWKVSYTKENGSIGVGNSLRGTGSPPPQSIYLDTQDEAQCLDGGDKLPVPPLPDVPVHEYTDPDTNCNYTVTFQGLIQESPEGPILPVFEVQGGETLRADGGRIGGCIMEPTIYVSPPQGPGGPGQPPVPPITRPPGQPPYVPGGGPGGGNDGIPWWVAPVVAGGTGALLNQLLDAIKELATPVYNAGSFTLVAPCNKDEEGNNLQRTWDFPESKYPERVVNHQVALMEIMQQHLDWKTPICDETTIPEGDFRTISFRSVEVSPYGKSRLRKRFRYRSVSGNDLGAVVDHWKDFSFEGGPYRVRWIGESWRSPEIWAASEAEGQRVIQHAAEEAGFGPLESGRWSARLSSSGRQGVPGTMRVDTTKGFYWITARDGSSERPIVAKV